MFFLLIQSVSKLVHATKYTILWRDLVAIFYVKQDKFSSNMACKLTKPYHSVIYIQTTLTCVAVEESLLPNYENISNFHITANIAICSPSWYENRHINN